MKIWGKLWHTKLSIPFYYNSTMIIQCYSKIFLVISKNFSIILSFRIFSQQSFVIMTIYIQNVITCNDNIHQMSLSIAKKLWTKMEDVSILKNATRKVASLAFCLCTNTQPPSQPNLLIYETVIKCVIFWDIVSNVAHWNILDVFKFVILWP